MSWGAVGAAVVGAVVASETSKSNANKAIDAQQDQNTANAAFIAEKTAEAREDVLPLFAAAQEARGLGFQAALDVFGQTIPQQIGVFQQGNVAAQQALTQGLPQIQAAILGQPVNLQQFQPQALGFGAGIGQPVTPQQPQVPGIGQQAGTQQPQTPGIGTSFAQQQIPQVTQPILTAQAETTRVLSGIVTNEDLFRAAAEGLIPDLSEGDRQFFVAHLGNIQRNPDLDAGSFKGALGTSLVDDPSQRQFVGRTGGFNTMNENRLVNLLNKFKIARG